MPRGTLSLSGTRSQVLGCNVFEIGPEALVVNSGGTAEESDNPLGRNEAFSV